eukprot:1374722-Prymnesium_polylepis.1
MPSCVHRLALAETWYRGARRDNNRTQSARSVGRSLSGARQAPARVPSAAPLCVHRSAAALQPSQGSSAAASAGLQLVLDVDGVAFDKSALARIGPAALLLVELLRLLGEALERRRRLWCETATGSATRIR